MTTPTPQKAVRTTGQGKPAPVSAQVTHTIALTSHMRYGELPKRVPGAFRFVASLADALLGRVELEVGVHPGTPLMPDAGLRRFASFAAATLVASAGGDVVERA